MQPIDRERGGGIAQRRRSLIYTIALFSYGQINFNFILVSVLNYRIILFRF